MLCRTGTPSASAVAMAEDSRETAPAVLPPLPESASDDPRDLAAAPTDRAAQQEPEKANRPRTPSGKGAPRPKRVAPTRRPLPPESLPPFPPALYGAAPLGEPASGPPPSVLWLSGVIQGDPKVALLRRGSNRYLVREGDKIENRYRVTRISSDSVTLRRGTRTQTLRLGQY
ncbi:MAG: hypothetical protein OEW93_10795 [Candidatus Bathyarchaeota archaeon]|nr:hypothetical protein [Candidatus Bathyarchaeota archaeon]